MSSIKLQKGIIGSNMGNIHIQWYLYLRIQRAKSTVPHLIGFGRRVNRMRLYRA